MPAELWNTPVEEIDPPALLDFVLELQAKVPETAMRLRHRLETVFDDCIFHRQCSANPAAVIKRKLREGQVRRERGAFAALPYAEAPAFMQRLRAAPGIAARWLEFAVLTTARTSEAILAEWPEIDLEAGIWTVPGVRMKGGEEHRVYLSQRAIEIVNAHRGLDKRFVFGTPNMDGTPMFNMAMLVLPKRLGVNKQTTVHGLCRSTFSTWANATGAARPDVIEACLAHREGDKIRRAYNRSQFAVERKALLAKWAEFFDGKQSASNVIPRHAKTA